MQAIRDENMFSSRICATMRSAASDVLTLVCSAKALVDRLAPVFAEGSGGGGQRGEKISRLISED